MTVKSVYLPHLGRHAKLGRRRPIARCPRLTLRRYLTGALPRPPAHVDYSPAAETALENVYLNDELGDCVIAGGYHIVGTLTGNAGKLFTATKEQIVADYSAIGGYDPSAKPVLEPDGTSRNPTDNGCNEQDALNYWSETGFKDGTRLLGWVTIDATSLIEVQTAVWLFENVLFGMELPDYWIHQGMPQGSGFVWDVAGDPVPENGHAVCGVGYDQHGVTIDTWGLRGCLTYAAAAKYAVRAAGGELYTALSPDQIARGQQRAPNGIAWSNLIADFDAMGGRVPEKLIARRQPFATLDRLGAAPAPSPTSNGAPKETGAGMSQAHAVAGNLLEAAL